MTMIWLLPPVALLFGTLVTVWLMRSTETVAGDIHRQLTDLGEVRQALLTVRVESDRTRAAFEQLHRR